MMKAIGSYVYRLMRKPLSILVVMVAVLAIVTVTAFTQNTKTPPPPVQSVPCDSRLEWNATKGMTRDQAMTPPEKSPGVIPSALIPSLPTVASNYTFSTATNASLTDMSSGTTQLIAADVDDTASALTNIGFDFYFQGARFTQFSVNENGVLRLGAAAQAGSPYQPLAQAGLPIITAYGADQRTHAGNGKVHFKVTGAAPNRLLVIEWLNTQANFNSGGTADLTYQARLSETTGVIEFVYGSMTMSAAGAASTDSQDPNIGFSSSNTAGTVGSVTAAQSGTPAPTFDGASATAVGNLYTAGSITVLSSATDGVRRRFTFTPPTPTAPTNLTFTGVTASAMTLNWTDSANETIYAIYRSTDGVNYAFFNTAAQNATSINATGLNPSTTYFWQVYAVSEGALSTALSGSQMTNAAVTIMSTAAGGNWSAGATWVGGIVPTAGDNVTIVDGATVTVDVTTATCLNLTVGQGTSGILQYISTPASTLTVNSDVTVTAGGTFTAGAGSLLTHILNIGGNTSGSGAAGNLTVNGTFDMNTTAGVTTNFFGSSDGTLSGAGATCDFFAIVMQKGTSQTPVLNVTRVITANVPAASANRLSATNGTFKLSSASVLTPWFGNQTLAATTGRIWLNNAAASATVVGVGTGTGAGAPTINGTLQVDAGTFGYGSGNNTMTIGAVGALVIGGASATVNIFGAVSFTNGATFTMMAGNFNVDPQAANNLAATTNIVRFNSVNVAFTGGTLTVVDPHAATGTGVAISISTSNAATFNFAGSTIRFGNGVSTTAGSVDGFDLDTFVGNALVQIGNVTVDNTATNAATRFVRAANALAPFQQLYGGNLTVTNSGGSEFRLNGHLVAISGNVINNGTINGTVAASRLYFLGGGVAQTYSGTGTVTTPLVQMDFDNPLGVTFDPAVSQIIVGSRINLFRGTSTNSNKLTIGNAGATQKDVQYGVAAGVTPGGNFDQAPVFNLGTGNYVVTYAQESVPRTTAFEIPSPSNTVTSVAVNNTNGVILGGNIIITGTLTLTAGNITTNANTLSIGSAGTVARTSGHVIGNFLKTYAAAANKTFEVGTANGYSPVAVNVTAGTFPADFVVKAVQGAQPNIATPTRALQRYWTLTATGVTADLTFNYLDPTDIPAGATEANFVIFKYDGMFTMPGGSVNTAANTASITGVTSFSDWTLAEPNAPTDVALNGFMVDGLAASPSAPQGGVLLRWQTGFEVANLGFNLYRDDGGKRTRLNPNLIAGSAFFVGPNTVLGAGRSYVWRDTQASNPAAQYWLEEINFKGNSFWHGPVVLSSVGKLAADSFEPNARLLSDLSTDQNADTATHTVERFATQRRVTAAALVTQQVLTSNSTIKIAVNREGWYQIKVADLITAGLDGRINPQFLQLFVDGREQPINVTTNKDGTLSGIEFYGTSVDNAYTNDRAYWLLVGATPGLRIAKVTSAGNAPPGGSFLTTVERRDRMLYFPALRNGERENFFGAVVAHDAVDQTLTLARVNSSAATAATLEVTLQGVTSQAHSVRVELNGSYAGTLSFANQASASASFNVAHALLREGANTVRLVPLGGPGDICLADTLRLSYQHYNTADGEALRLTATGGQALTIDGFSKPAIRVLDITDAGAVRELVGVVQQQKGGNSVSLLPPGTGQRTLLALANDLPAPASVVASPASSWRQPLNGADLVVITRREFAAALDSLVTLRRKQGLSVAVVDIEEIYNEFSFGQKTPQAVKDFLAYAATSWKKKPRYVLLAADASYDPKNYLGLGNSDLVPTKLFDTQYMETAFDDWLVDFNNDGVPELAIGRLPARTASEALTMATKIVRYSSQPPADSLLLVCDLSDTFDFASASESLRALIPPDVRTQSLHRGDADDATTHAQLLAAINNGQRLVNYVGHGSTDLWRGGLLTAADVSNLTNSDRLTIFVMMTCLNGYYTDPGTGSLGESLLKSERGGAVAVWASSGMTLPDAQAVMNQEVYRQMFNGQGLTIGEAMMRAKAAVASGDVRRTWILLGDPTMKLR
jgi:hypothetical protein